METDRGGRGVTGVESDIPRSLNQSKIMKDSSFVRVTTSKPFPDKPSE